MQSFQELNLSAPILRAISELGFEKPSPIQEQALPLLLKGPTDFLGLAATGTGKTAAFAIPLLEQIDPQSPGVQGLILCPTRELAVQVSEQINLLGRYKRISSVPIYGGSSYSKQIQGLRQGASVVVGTPGRVKDHMERGTLNLSTLKTVILDEADEMISMGFKEDLEIILGSAPKGESNTWLFSATMSSEVRKMADGYLTDPEQVQINKKEVLAENIEQIFYVTQEQNKPDVLCKLIDAADDLYGLIFCQTKSLVIDVNQYLLERGYRSDCLHGDMDQNARERTMRAFREHKLNVLVCTDVASRGLDVKDITHVINYSIPRELDSYVHRIGRTARSGKSGFAMNLVTGAQRYLIGRVERTTKSKMREGKIPTRKELAAKKISRALEAFQSCETHSKAVELMDLNWVAAIAEMDAAEIAGRFLALMHPEVFSQSEKFEKPKPLSDQPRPFVVKSERSRPSADRFERSRPQSDRFEKPRTLAVKPLSSPSPSSSFGAPKGEGRRREFQSNRGFKSEGRAPRERKGEWPRSEKGAPEERRFDRSRQGKSEFKSSAAGTFLKRSKKSDSPWAPRKVGFGDVKARRSF